MLSASQTLMAQFTLSVPPDVKMTFLGSRAPIRAATWERAFSHAAYGVDQSAGSSAAVLAWTHGTSSHLLLHAIPMARGRVTESALQVLSTVVRFCLHTKESIKVHK